MENEMKSVKQLTEDINSLQDITDVLGRVQENGASPDRGARCLSDTSSDLAAVRVQLDGVRSVALSISPLLCLPITHFSTELVLLAFSFAGRFIAWDVYLARDHVLSKLFVPDVTILGDGFFISVYRRSELDAHTAARRAHVSSARELRNQVHAFVSFSGVQASQLGVSYFSAAALM